MTIAATVLLFLLSLLSILQPIQSLSFITPNHVVDKLCRDARVLGAALLVTAATSAPPAAALAASTPAASIRQQQQPKENYLPRRLYPGTYQNYCGPTPEVSPGGGCVAHGWHGDNAVDAVDDACRLHDLGYCKCQSELLSRRREGRTTTTTSGDDIDVTSSSLLSSAVALRFVTKPVLAAEQASIVDSDYLSCIKKADQELLTRGIQLRSEQQRDNCSSDPSIAWFCRPSSKTLQAFERVNLNIFLHNMDSDDNNSSKRAPTTSLVQWEHQRQVDIAKETKTARHSLSEAVSSSAVQHDEEEMLQLLAK